MHRLEQLKRHVIYELSDFIFETMKEYNLSLGEFHGVMANAEIKFLGSNLMHEKVELEEIQSTYESKSRAVIKSLQEYQKMQGRGHSDEVEES